MIKFFKKNYWIILIILGGLFLRIFHPLTLFQYSHDQDLAGWFVRDILINHHLRLIGQETSSHGVFIGPYFYYLQIPFYLLTKMDPAGTLLLPIILGTFSIFSVYYVFNKMISRNAGLIGALIYSFSILIVFTDREVVPTMPVVLWTIWFLFAIWKILNKQKYGYIIIGFLFGLIWSINLQLVIVAPLILFAQIFSKGKINFKELIIGIVIAVILNIPFVAFEVRHGFQQTKSLVSSLTTNKDYSVGTAKGFLPRLDRTMQLTYKNSTDLFDLNLLNVNPQIIFWLLNILLIYLIYKKKVNLQFGIILFIWQLIYILFFTKLSINLSEYYLNGMNIIFILLTAIGVKALIENKKTKSVGVILILGFVIINLYSFAVRPVNANGYIERKGIIEAIKDDAKMHNYPCVSLSFIVSPGNNLGYRYFTWELGLKTKHVSKEVPTYSIVFPLSGVDRFDKSFGALGLVLPDYKRYNDSTIQKACAGDDYTVTEPMFGFTK
ncbi:hypothetical protein BH10PAT1_BH10PAT1_7750 [soil metagenome]